MEAAITNCVDNIMNALYLPRHQVSNHMINIQATPPEIRTILLRHIKDLMSKFEDGVEHCAKWHDTQAELASMVDDTILITQHKVCANALRSMK